MKKITWKEFKKNVIKIKNGDNYDFQDEDSKYYLKDYNECLPSMAIVRSFWQGVNETIVEINKQ